MGRISTFPKKKKKEYRGWFWKLFIKITEVFNGYSVVDIRMNF